MTDYGHDLQFGVFLTPSAKPAGRVVELAEVADVVGLDLVTAQDHPYQARFLDTSTPRHLDTSTPRHLDTSTPRHLDTSTLLTVIAARTSQVRVAVNVANLPLRPPMVLARSVASLDTLSGGRVELGMGAGAFWDAIAAMGGRRRSPGRRPTGCRPRSAGSTTSTGHSAGAPDSWAERPRTGPSSSVP